jgi:nucleoside-diphosphate-sugar epimerase
MKILVAGATGAIGQPLLNYLINDGHDVYGITQSKERALTIAGKGAKPVLLNVLEKEDVNKAIESIRPEIIVDMLTHLPKEYTPEAMKASSELDSKIRLEGGSNLQEAGVAHGMRRYIVQSAAYWYAPGTGYADEGTPFALEASPGVCAGVHTIEKIEQRVLQSPQIEGVALRFGFFYGPGTWFHPHGNVADQIRKRQYPVIGKGEGVWNFIHVEDAAKSITSAVYSYPGAYNIVNNRPTRMGEWLPAFAYYIGAAPPLWISEEEGLKQKGADAVYYATKLRAVSNEKAKREFNFQPRTFEWLK